MTNLKPVKKDTAYDASQLEAGQRIEMEHTKDPETAEKIAKHHLDEYPTYYTALKDMESELEKARAANKSKNFCRINKI